MLYFILYSCAKSILNNEVEDILLRKRIYRISEDKFDEVAPEIELSQNIINETCHVGNDFKGVFSITSVNGVDMRGLVYSDHPYINVTTPSFTGLSVNIGYEIADHHFKAGENISGHFTILAQGIEKKLPYSISFVRKPLETMYGTISSLEDLMELAKGHFSEAQKLFYSEEFAEFATTLPIDKQLLYKGYRAGLPLAANLDEFLVACKLKERMTFEVKTGNIEHYGARENVKGELELTRNTWGFIEINVSSDNDFIALERDVITQDYFLGSVFTMNYYVLADKLHEGLNYATISFDFGSMHRSIVVMACKDEEGVIPPRPVYDRDVQINELLKLYIDYRLRRITTAEWCNATVARLEQIMPDREDADDALNDEINEILLHKTLCYITNKQNKEALWLIQDLKRTIISKQGYQWAYLLYLCTLIEREKSYVDRLTEDVEKIFRNHESDVRIFWFLLFLREEYVKNPSAKLRDIADFVEKGFNTPFLYIEAFYVYLQDPYLLNNLDDFSIKVLNWARKNGAITKDLAIQMMHAIDTQKEFNPHVFPILRRCYAIFPDMQFLLSIVTYLLKAPELKEEYFPWFKKALEYNLSVAGLFEAYINTMPTNNTDPLPSVVTMFLKYNNSLSYEKKALVYSNIILHKVEEPEVYAQFQPIIENFALEQMKLGHLDDNLAICYQMVLENGVVDDKTAILLAEFIFRKKIAVLPKNARRVLLYQEEFDAPLTVAVSDHQAYVKFIVDGGRMFIEQNSGKLIADKSAYMIQDIMEPGEFIPVLRRIAPDAMSFILSDFKLKTKASDFSVDDIPAIQKFINAPEVSEKYKRRLYPVIVEFLKNHNREDLVLEYFMKIADILALPADLISEVFDIFVNGGKLEEAYTLLLHVNCSQVKAESLKTVIDYKLHNIEFAEDDMLIIYSAYLVKKGFFTDVMLVYLLTYFLGETDTMLTIFNKAKERNMDVAEFAERIIVQMLYKDDITGGLAVFESYYGRRTNKMVVEAYLTYQAHEYLEGKEIPEIIFSYILQRHEKTGKINESMRIALMRYLCLKGNLDEIELEVLDGLIGDAISRNQQFGFFAAMDRRLLVKYQLYDKYFIEFKGETKKRVIISYSINGSSVVEEEMTEMYDGIYIKQLIVFFGDEIAYEVHCDEISDQPLDKQTVSVAESMADAAGSRYDMMNTLNRMVTYKEGTDIAITMKQYQGLDVLTKKLYSIV